MRSPWTPGAYIARRRRAAGRSLDDIAAQLHTVPHPVGERDRVLWLASIEADVAPIPAAIGELRRLFPFDPAVLAALVARSGDPAIEIPRLCRICGCSERDPCVIADLGCAWVDGEDLCTDCALTPEAPDARGAPGSPTSDAPAPVRAVASIARPVGALCSGQSTSIDPGA